MSMGMIIILQQSVMIDDGLFLGIRNTALDVWSYVPEVFVAIFFLDSQYNCSVLRKLSLCVTFNAFLITLMLSLNERKAYVYGLYFTYGKMEMLLIRVYSHGKSRNITIKE